MNPDTRLLAAVVQRPLAEKERDLRATLAGLGRAVVAFSGGIDSAVLGKVAAQELGRGVTLALAVGPSLPEQDRRDASSSRC